MNPKTLVRMGIGIVRTVQEKEHVTRYGPMRNTLFVLVVPTYKLVHTFRGT